jgi:hypothetical protein
MALYFWFALIGLYACMGVFDSHSTFTNFGGIEMSPWFGIAEALLFLAIARAAWPTRPRVNH